MPDFDHYCLLFWFAFSVMQHILLVVLTYGFQMILSVRMREVF